MTTILQVKERIFLNKYVIKRIGLAIVTLVIISLITFFAMNAIPGGPFDTEKATSPEVKAVLTDCGTVFHLYGKPAAR